MAINISFSRDEQGFYSADLPEPLFALGDFLISDLQAAPNSCLRMLDVVKRIVDGTLPTWRGTGNAYRVQLDQEKAVISCLWDEDMPPAVVSLADFADAIGKWLKYITQTTG